MWHDPIRLAFCEDSQKGSALAQWFAARTADRRASTRKTMIVALARNLLIALWRLATLRVRGSAGHHLTPGVMSSGTEQQNKLTLQPILGLLMQSRGSGDPTSKPWLSKPLCRLGPLPRSFAADAHDCIMVPILTDRPNTRSWRDSRARWRAPPRIMSNFDRHAYQTTQTDERNAPKKSSSRQ